MFGIGFTEILFIAVIAILFLGPDKLPEAMVQVAKFLNSFKKTISEAKAGFENEIHMADLKREANQYKEALTGANSSIDGFKNAISSPIDDLNEALSNLDNDKELLDEIDTDTQEPNKSKKKSKKKKKREKVSTKETGKNSTKADA